MTLQHAEAGAKGGNATRWRAEPCPAFLVLGNWNAVECQRLQRHKGDRVVTHRHQWDGEVDGKRVELCWFAP